MNPSELDTLADYVEGLLDGTPEAAAVEAKIAEDPAWADAYAQLTAANPAVTAALAGLADPPVPPAVSAGLRSVLASARPPSPERPGDVEAEGAEILASPTPLRRRESGRGSTTRVAGWVVAAAVVALAAIGGLAQLVHQPSTNDNASSGDRAAAPKAVRASASVDPATVRNTGTAYTAAEFGPQIRALIAQVPAAEAPSPGVTSGTDAATEEAPMATHAEPTGPLRRLGDPSALDNCLTSFGGFYPLAVDYGTYDGQPAVVVVTFGDSARQVLATAVGAGCGTNGESQVLNSVVVGR